MRYSHIVFDIDGTMTDTFLPLMQSLSDTVHHYLGVRMEPEELRFAFGITSNDTYDRLGIEDKQGAQALWQSRFEVYGKGIQLFPGITDTLHQLHDMDCVLGIITSKSYFELMDSFTPFGLNELFLLAITADDTRQHKPHPAPMQLFLKQTGAKPNRVLYVGDSVYDMGCCHGAGVDGALACWGNPNWQTVEAEYHPQTPQDLIAIAKGEA